MIQDVLLIQALQVYIIYIASLYLLYPQLQTIVAALQIAAVKLPHEAQKKQRKDNTLNRNACEDEFVTRTEIDNEQLMKVKESRNEEGSSRN